MDYKRTHVRARSISPTRRHEYASTEMLSHRFSLVWWGWGMGVSLLWPDSELDVDGHALTPAKRATFQPAPTRQSDERARRSLFGSFFDFEILTGQKLGGDLLGQGDCSLLLFQHLHSFIFFISFSASRLLLLSLIYIPQLLSIFVSFSLSVSFSISFSSLCFPLSYSHCFSFSVLLPHGPLFLLLFICLSACLSVSRSVCLSVRLSVFLFICLSFCQ